MNNHLRENFYATVDAVHIILGFFFCGFAGEENNLAWKIFMFTVIIQETIIHGKKLSAPFDGFQSSFYTSKFYICHDEGVKKREEWVDNDCEFQI